MTQDNAPDQLAMLFSTDWFQPCMSVTGYSVLAGREAEFLEEIRRIVDEMVAGAPEYWLVSFDQVRLEHTKGRFLNALDRFRGASATTQLLLEEIGGQSHAERMSLPCVARMRELHDRLSFDLDSIAIDLTVWDQKIIALTPDLPAYGKDNLSHYFLHGRQWEVDATG